MSLTAPYRQQHYMGEFPDNEAALDFVQSNRWDDTSDGEGNPREGMTYYDTTNHKLKLCTGGNWVALFGNGDSVYKADIVDSITAKRYPVGEESIPDDPDMSLEVALPLVIDENGSLKGYAEPYLSGSDTPVLSLFDPGPIEFSLSMGKVNGIANVDLAHGNTDDDLDWRQIDDAFPIGDGCFGVGILQYDPVSGVVRAKKNEKDASIPVHYEQNEHQNIFYGSNQQILLMRPVRNTGPDQVIGQIEHLYFDPNNSSGTYHDYSIVIYEFVDGAVGNLLWESDPVSFDGYNKDIAAEIRSSYGDNGKTEVGLTFANNAMICFGVRSLDGTESYFLCGKYVSGLSGISSSWELDASYTGGYVWNGSSWVLMSSNRTYVLKMTVHGSNVVTYPLADEGLITVGLIGTPNIPIKNNFGGSTTTALRRVPMDVLKLDQSELAALLLDNEAAFSFFGDEPLPNVIAEQQIENGAAISAPFWASVLKISASQNVDLGAGNANFQSGLHYGQRLLILNDGSSSITIHSGDDALIRLANQDSSFAFEPYGWLDVVWSKNILPGGSDGWLEIGSSRQDTRLASKSELEESTKTVTTSDATETTLDAFPIKEGEAVELRVRLVAKAADDSMIMSRYLNATAARRAGEQVRIIGEYEEYGPSESDAGRWSAKLEAATGELRLIVKGDSTNSVAWKSHSSAMRID